MDKNNQFHLSFSGALRQVGTGDLTAPRFVYVLKGLSKKERTMLENDIASWDADDYITERNPEGRACPIKVGESGDIIFFSSKKIDPAFIEQARLNRYTNRDGNIDFGLYDPMKERLEELATLNKYRAEFPLLTVEEIRSIIFGA